LKTLEYAGVCVQARQVGGDYFEFPESRPQRLGLIIGDVSGKGIAAALLMAEFAASFRSQSALAFDQPEALLRSVNRLFYDNTGDSAYASLCLPITTRRRGDYATSIAAHLSGLLLRRDGKVDRLESTSTLLGLFREWNCSMREQELSPGDVLALYTDGITEASNERGEEFGERCLVESLQQHRDLPCQALLSAIVDGVRQFSFQEQHDDIRRSWRSSRLRADVSSGGWKVPDLFRCGTAALLDVSYLTKRPHDSPSMPKPQENSMMIQTSKRYAIRCGLNPDGGHSPRRIKPLRSSPNPNSSSRLLPIRRDPRPMERHRQQARRHGAGFPRRQIRLQLQKDQRTFALNLLHAAAFDYIVIRRVSGTNVGPDFGEGDNPTRDAFKTKADVVKFRPAGHCRRSKVIQQQGDAGLDKTAPWGKRLAHNSYLWTFAIEHSGEHYGQLVVYYRANNLVPPDSRR